MFIKAAAASALFASAVAAPVEKRATCPPIHVFGARETTAPAGYGSAGTVVKLILNAHPGATAEAINYPAAGGTDAAYASSVQAGAQAVASQINTFNTECPSTLLVYVGYSQGAQIADDALCGGGDPNDGITYTYPLISSAASNAIKAIIWMGDPRHSPGKPFNYGTATAGGVNLPGNDDGSITLTYLYFDARPSGFSCPTYTSRIRSYCNAPDPYCSDGDDAATHQGYGTVYGQNALAFVNALL